jgi:hypothetical protein
LLVLGCSAAGNALTPAVERMASFHAFLLMID